MIKKLIVLSLVLASFSSLSATLSITGPCSEKPILTFEMKGHFETVGDFTIYLLQKNRIPHLGNERAINSIFHTPVGMDALEVVSDTQMRAYGWCYKVNGEVFEKFAEEVYLNDSDDIEWFFAYAWYDKGWVSMCNPAYAVPGRPMCKAK